jgi:hypothetical protein
MAPIFAVMFLMRCFPERTVYFESLSVKIALKSLKMALLRSLELPARPSQRLPSVAPQFRLYPVQPISSAAVFVDALRANRNSAHLVVRKDKAEPRNLRFGSYVPIGTLTIQNIHAIA